MSVFVSPLASFVADPEGLVSFMGMAVCTSSTIIRTCVY